MKKLALHFTVAFACTILLCACQTPSPNAEGRAQQKSNAPIPLGDPDVPTHDMCAFSNKRLPATHGQIRLAADYVLFVDGPAKANESTPSVVRLPVRA